MFKSFFCSVGFLIISLTISEGQNTAVNAETQKIKSTIAVPIDIDYVDIERMLNQSVTGLIYEDNSYADNDQDEFKIKVWKKGNITIKPNTTNQLKISVPLKVWAEKGIGALGYVSYQATEFELILNFKTVFSIRPDWVIKTVTTPDGYTWVTKPVLKYKYVDVPITPIVANVLDKQHPMFAKKIDEQVVTALDMKPYALQVWNLLNTPFQLSEEYESWLTIRPSGVQMTPLKAQKNNIVSTIGLNVISETSVGKKPVTSLNTASSQVPNLTLVKDVPSTFSVETVADISYSYASELANKSFQFQKIDFLNGKKSVVVDEIIVMHEADMMILSTKLSGDVKGTVIIEGHPYYDSLAQRLALKDVVFQLKTKNLFQKSASWLFNGKIETMIEKDYGIPVGDMIKLANTSLLSTLNQSPYPGVIMKGTVASFKPTDVVLNEDGITILILTKGQMGVKLQM
ncbi:MAG: DUF4403 family protein [Saprospiraceae bacterium]|jgi:hypothetical protein|uniref:DUF4403 family protein n=1 Tax=Candidatus Brachybacter algidus TaxID=2982024 RepID=UPI001B43AAF6|nr:DUF4403 family protein [Candidatus Brachybacter algidus]MBP7541144.1 DUF4403 family protein [Saprospiraceae bacterium]MBK6373571.1 DUF4403 family protein [Candidatus Brachybacter algidus]MBK6450965.1 DUF4403 family protein [Candidatus Brachybacter algidus]MBK7605075.1 DUF4403 family protein [Candidatus Brachybacter algidus]MBK8842284.1 DUF4403 family protein [Candidatus Brachybacter algidus]